jgi:hypothetical protein
MRAAYRGNVGVVAEEKLLGRYEMLWDCSFCGASKLLAKTYRHCPECGAPQDQTKRYFPPEGEKVAVTDAYAGTDKVCASCKHANGAKSTHCAQCGAPLEGAASVKVRSEQKVVSGQRFLADDATAAESELADNARPKPAPVKKKSWAWLYILIAVAGLCFVIWFMCIRKRTADFEVMEQRWKRAVAIEEWKEVMKETWKRDLPSGARVTSCHEKEYEQRKVEDGQECSMKRIDKGDGTFEEREECHTKYRSEPVYRTWCRFGVFEWTEIDRKVAQTNDGTEPTWPDTGLAGAKVAQEAGARREGKREEVFELEVQEPKGARHTCAVSEALWKKLPKGAAAKGEVRARSGDIVCDSLRAK